MVSNIALIVKQAMIDAMFEHWEGGYEARFNQVVNDNNSANNRVRAHIHATHDHDKPLLPKEPA